MSHKKVNSIRKFGDYLIDLQTQTESKNCCDQSIKCSILYIFFVFSPCKQMKSKYDKQLSADLLEWIAEITGEEIDTDGSEENFQKVLANGEILCK